jgi:hypothetical protein
LELGRGSGVVRLKSQIGSAFDLERCDMLTLLNETAGQALDLLEKNGVLFPLCRALDVDHKTLFIAADDPTQENDAEVSDEDLARSVDSIRIELKRRISAGEILEFAFCSDELIKLQNEPGPRRFLEIEFQNGSEESAIYLFPLSVETGKAHLAPKYLRANLHEKLL